MSEILVVLPGWTRSERSYKRLVDSAPKGYKVIVANHHEIIPTGNIDDFIDQFVSFLKARNLNKVSLIGHSLGGAMAMEFAMHYPEMVDKLYLVDSAGVYGQETIFELSNNLLRNLFTRGHTKLVKFFTNSGYLIRKLPMHIKLGRYAFKVDLKEQGSKIKNYTIIMWGEKDVLNSLWQGRALQKAIPRSKLIVLKDQGHDWIVYSPHLFWQNI